VSDAGDVSEIRQRLDGNLDNFRPVARDLDLILAGKTVKRPFLLDDEVVAENG
jgi:hypothetical protein